MSIRRIIALAVASLAVQAIPAWISAPAHAEFDITFAQVGADVVATGVGSVDLSGLTDEGAITGGTIAPFVNASLGAVGLVLTSGSGGEEFAGTTGPATFGSGHFIQATSGTGPLFVINGTNADIVVPSDYISGDLISDTATWTNATIAGLGLVPGTYTESWDTTPPQTSGLPAVRRFDAVSTDDVKVVIPAAVAVPEPLSAALLALPVVSIVLLRRRRERGTSVG